MAPFSGTCHPTFLIYLTTSKPKCFLSYFAHRMRWGVVSLVLVTWSGEGGVVIVKNIVWIVKKMHWSGVAYLFLGHWSSGRGGANGLGISAGCTCNKEQLVYQDVGQLRTKLFFFLNFCVLNLVNSTSFAYIVKSWILYTELWHAFECLTYDRLKMNYHQFLHIVYKQYIVLLELWLTFYKWSCINGSTVNSFLALHRVRNMNMETFRSV